MNISLTALGGVLLSIAVLLLSPLPMIVLVLTILALVCFVVALFAPHVRRGGVAP